MHDIIIIAILALIFLWILIARFRTPKDGNSSCGSGGCGGGCSGCSCTPKKKDEE